MRVKSETVIACATGEKKKKERERERERKRGMYIQPWHQSSACLLALKKLPNLRRDRAAGICGSGDVGQIFYVNGFRAPMGDPCKRGLHLGLGAGGRPSGRCRQVPELPSRCFRGGYLGRFDLFWSVLVVFRRSQVQKPREVREEVEAMAEGAKGCMADL